LLTRDGQRIYFGSQRPDGGALGDQDIWTATRLRTEDPFSNVSHVTELSPTLVDLPRWVSVDGCRLYLLSNRDTGAGTHLYVASKPSL
jgi:hypothetical protein